MTTIKFPGVKRFVSKGRAYHYLRATGERVVDPKTGVPLDPASDPTAFLRRVEAMKLVAAGLPQPANPRPGTLLRLIDAYRGVPDRDGGRGHPASPEWSALAPATRTSYDRVLDPLGGYLRRSLHFSLDDIELCALSPPVVLRIRNRVAKRFGFWTANYTVSVLRSVFRWGILYGHLDANPAAGVPKLARPEGLPVKHRSWADEEFTAVSAEARRRGLKGVVVALTLSRFAGWPLGDVVNQPPSVWQSPRLVYVRRKTRRKARVTDMVAPSALRRVLEEFPPLTSAPTLVTNVDGNPYSEARMRQVIYRLCSSLAERGVVRRGLNIHGLRHTLGRELYELGLDREARKAVMAHHSDAASAVYERDGDRARIADAAVLALNKRHAPPNGTR